MVLKRSQMFILTRSLGGEQGKDEVLPTRLQIAPQAGPRAGQEDVLGARELLRGWSLVGADKDADCVASYREKDDLKGSWPRQVMGELDTIGLLPKQTTGNATFVPMTCRLHQYPMPGRPVSIHVAPGVQKIGLDETSCCLYE